jgi:hypothetical protein
MGGTRLLLAAVVLGFAATPADASTLTLGTESGGLPGGDPPSLTTTAVRYRAEPGEANDLRISIGAAYRLSVVDSGATIAAPAGCKQSDAHRVTCTTPTPVTSLDVGTGDRDDVVAADVHEGPHVFAHVATGAGNDTATLEGAILGYLNGGGGDDVLSGGDEPDQFTGGPGSDNLDGGSGIDWVRYDDHAQPVAVDLAAGRGGGAGERDQLARFESVAGGSAGDALAGDDSSNQLIGGGGSDVISGRDGSDVLTGGLGNDSLIAGAGDDTLFGQAGRDLLFGGAGYDQVNTSDGAGRRDSADIVSCGADTDDVIARRPRHARARDADLFTTDCETLGFDLPGTAIAVGGHPLSAQDVSLGFSCLRRYRRGCRVSLLVKAGPTLVAAGRSRVAHGRDGAVRAPLSVAGRALVARREPIPVLVRVRFQAGRVRRAAVFRLLLPPAT